MAKSQQTPPSKAERTKETVSATIDEGIVRQIEQLSTGNRSEVINRLLREALSESSRAERLQAQADLARDLSEMFSERADELEAEAEAVFEAESDVVEEAKTDAYWEEVAEMAEMVEQRWTVGTPTETRLVESDPVGERLLAFGVPAEEVRWDLVEAGAPEEAVVVPTTDDAANEGR